MAPPTEKSILVVEDDPECMESIVDALAIVGYHVERAENGAEALAQLVAGAQPDLVLLDLMMPVMDGWVFVRELGKRGLARAPIVILSGEHRLVQIAADLQVAGYLKKPIDVDTLLTTVEELAARPSEQERGH